MRPDGVTLVSGGQTGADRAALDFAIAHGIPHGGWCPAGRKSEDGPIDPRYQLKETPRSGYVQRTEWNVRDSDGTVVFSIAAELTGGSKKTVFLAHKHGKPVLRISRDRSTESPERLRRFIQEHSIKVLNVAGPRASKEPEVYAFAKEVLTEALAHAPEPAAGETVKVAIGNQETAMNLLYEKVIKKAYSGINFSFERASYVGEFIALAAKPDTRLAIFTPPGNLKQGPGDPVPTLELDAVGIVRAIKAKSSVPVIVIAAQSDDGQAVLAAGADVFLDLPVKPQEIVDAVARCLGLVPRKLVPL